MREQGWYRDPYGIHEDRWFSEGRPTALVSDEGMESRDEPPPGAPPAPLVPAVARQPITGSLPRLHGVRRVVLIVVVVVLVAALVILVLWVMLALAINQAWSSG